MTKFNIIFFTVVTLSFANNSYALVYKNNIIYLPNDTTYVCYITDFVSKSGEEYVEIRPIQFLWGLEAVIEAKKNGAAEYDIDKVTKDTTWYVPNDYYIVDRHNSEFMLTISDQVKVSIYDQAVLKKITMKEMLMNPEYYQIQYYNKDPLERIGEMVYYPYEIAVEKGEVTIIQEIYIP